MVKMNEVIKLLVSMKIRIRRLKKKKGNRCGRSSNVVRNRSFSINRRRQKEKMNY